MRQAASNLDVRDLKLIATMIAKEIIPLFRRTSAL
jgi:hypothetical protein